MHRDVILIGSRVLALSSIYAGSRNNKSAVFHLHDNWLKQLINPDNFVQIWSFYFRGLSDFCGWKVPSRDVVLRQTLVKCGKMRRFDGAKCNRPEFLAFHSVSIHFVFGFRFGWHPQLPGSRSFKSIVTWVARVHQSILITFSLTFSSEPWESGRETPCSNLRSGLEQVGCRAYKSRMLVSTCVISAVVAEFQVWGYGVGRPDQD